MTRLELLLLDLEQSQPLHLEVGVKMSQADNGNVWPLDLLARAVLNRSANLIPAFIMLTKERNFIASAPLLRLQIDNCLRFYAAFIVDDCHDLALNILKGVQVGKCKDKAGRFMTDRYLAERLNEEYPWVLNVYQRTCGYIHLSEAHIYNTMLPNDPENRSKGIPEIAIGPGDKFGSDDLYEEATEAFIEATNVMFTYLVGWVNTKDRNTAGI